MNRVCFTEGCSLAVCAQDRCRRCYKKAKRRGEISLIQKQRGSGPEAFWAKVDMSDGPHACWPISGFLDRDGYGTFSNIRAPRYAWMLTYGTYPDDFILHSCDFPACVNPAHLSVGTPAQNQAQMVERGRSCKGDKHYRRLQMVGV